MEVGGVSHYSGRFNHSVRFANSVVASGPTRSESLFSPSPLRKRTNLFDRDFHPSSSLVVFINRSFSLHFHTDYYIGRMSLPLPLMFVRLFIGRHLFNFCRPRNPEKRFVFRMLLPKRIMFIRAYETRFRIIIIIKIV